MLELQIDPPPGQQQIIQLGAEQQRLAQPQGRCLQAQVDVGSGSMPAQRYGRSMEEVAARLILRQVAEAEQLSPGGVAGLIRSHAELSG